MRGRQGAVEGSPGPRTMGNGREVGLGERVVRPRTTYPPRSLAGLAGRRPPLLAPGQCEAAGGRIRLGRQAMLPALGEGFAIKIQRAMLPALGEGSAIEIRRPRLPAAWPCRSEVAPPPAPATRRSEAQTADRVRSWRPSSFCRDRWREAPL